MLLGHLAARRRPGAATGDEAGAAAGVADGAPTGLVLAVSALIVVAAVDATVEVVRIGHSGAEATWSGTGSSVG